MSSCRKLQRVEKVATTEAGGCLVLPLERSPAWGGGYAGLQGQGAPSPLGFVLEEGTLGGPGPGPTEGVCAGVAMGRPHTGAVCGKCLTADVRAKDMFGPGPLPCRGDRESSPGHVLLGQVSAKTPGSRDRTEVPSACSWQHFPSCCGAVSQAQLPRLRGTGLCSHVSIGPGVPVRPWAAAQSCAGPCGSVGSPGLFGVHPCEAWRLCASSAQQRSPSPHAVHSVARGWHLSPGPPGPLSCW